MKKYETQILEICDNGDAILEFPDELTKSLDWRVDDVLKFDLSDDAIIIRNLSKEKRDIMTTKVFKDVKTFMQAAGQECPTTPTGKNDLSKLYGTLIAEEFSEFVTAYFHDNDQKELDACFDMIWVIVGYMHSRGWDADAAWDEGSISNLSKIDKETGKVIRRHDGKILKPQGWKEPDFSKFVKKGK